MNDIVKVVAPLTSVAEYDKVAAALADLHARFDNVVFDVTTTKGLDEAKKARADVREYRYGLEAKRKEIKAPALQRINEIDSEAKRLTAELLSIEDPIDKAIKAEEERKEQARLAKARAEAERILAINKRIGWMQGLPAAVIGKTAAEIELTLADLASVPLTEDLFAELLPNAQEAHAAATAKLGEMRSAAAAAAVEAARLAEERRVLEAEKAEQRRVAEEQRKEAERVAEEQRKAEEANRAEATRLAARQRELEQREEAQRQETANRERLERERQEQEARDKAAIAEAAAARRLGAGDPIGDGRRAFQMTDAEREAILAASAPVPYMVVGGVAPRSQQERANDAWQALGRARGFDYMTVQPSPGLDDRFFTAEPKSFVEEPPLAFGTLAAREATLAFGSAAEALRAIEGVVSNESLTDSYCRERVLAICAANQHRCDNPPCCNPRE